MDGCTGLRPAGWPRGSVGEGRCAGGAGWRSAFLGWCRVPQCDAGPVRYWKRVVQHKLRYHGELQRRGLHAIGLLDQERAVRVMIGAERMVLACMTCRTFVIMRRQPRSERAEQHDQVGSHRGAEGPRGSHGPDDAEGVRFRQREPRAPSDYRIRPGVSVSVFTPYRDTSARRSSRNRLTASSSLRPMARSYDSTASGPRSSRASRWARTAQ